MIRVLKLLLSSIAFLILPFLQLSAETQEINTSPENPGDSLTTQPNTSTTPETNTQLPTETTYLPEEDPSFTYQPPTSSEYPITIVLAPLNKSVLSSQIPSTVVHVTKKMGDSFKKGETLIQLDERVFLAKVKKAEAILQRARHALEIKQKLYQDKVASSIELATAQADIGVAEAELALADKELSDSIIRAPYNGNVVEVFVDENEMVQPGQKLIAVVNDHTLVAKMLIPSIYLKDLYLGQPIQLRIKETQIVLHAKISQIGAVIDPSSSMVKVYAEIDNHERKLTTGMIGTAKLEAAQGNDEQPTTTPNLKPSSTRKHTSSQPPIEMSPHLMQDAENKY